MKNTPEKITMWKDLNGKAWETSDLCKNENNTILEYREYHRKKRIIDKHIDIAFDDWLKYTDNERACDMRQGASKMIWYFLKHELLKESLFDK